MPGKCCWSQKSFRGNPERPLPILLQQSVHCKTENDETNISAYINYKHIAVDICRKKNKNNLPKVAAKENMGFRGKSASPHVHGPK